MKQSLSVENVRVEGRALGDFMRWRCTELSNLPTDEQTAQLALEVRQWLKDFSSTDQERILGEAELRFPRCENRSVSTVPAPSPSKAITLEDIETDELVDALAGRLALAPDPQRATVFNKLGFPTPEQTAPKSITVGEILAHISDVGRRSLKSGDPLLRDPNASGTGVTSVEKEFADWFSGALRRKLPESTEISQQALARTLASTLVELACIESLAFAVLMKLNSRVFDPVHGHLVRKQNVLWESLAAFLKAGDIDGFIVGLRQYTGLAKSLLFQYAWLADRNGELIAEFSPQNIARNAGGREWDAFVRRYTNMVRRLTELDPRALPDSEFIINAVREYVEARVSGTVNEHYNWQLKGMMQ